MLPNPWVILGALVFFLVSIGGASFFAYERGRDDDKAAYTAQQLNNANANIADMKRRDAESAKAGESHDAQIQTVHDTTREIIRTVTIPAGADPFLPVGFVRLFDRSASRSIGADSYPGKSDGSASNVRVSQAATLLVSNFDKCEQNRAQLANLISYLKAEGLGTQ